MMPGRLAVPIGNPPLEASSFPCTSSETIRRSSSASIKRTLGVGGRHISTEKWYVLPHSPPTPKKKKKWKPLFGADVFAPWCPTDQVFVKGGGQNPSFRNGTENNIRNAQNTNLVKSVPAGWSSPLFNTYDFKCSPNIDLFTIFVPVMSPKHFPSILVSVHKSLSLTEKNAIETTLPVVLALVIWDRWTLGHSKEYFI